MTKDDPYRKAARKQDQARRLRTHEGQRNHFVGELAVNRVRQIIREDDERKVREQRPRGELKLS